MTSQLGLPYETHSELTIATHEGEFKALEKHKENWTKDVKREIQLKEEDNLDDIAQTIFLRRQREERGE